MKGIKWAISSRSDTVWMDYYAYEIGLKESLICPKYPVIGSSQLTIGEYIKAITYDNGIYPNELYSPLCF